MIYSIADLHLSFTTSKPMDIFGDNWLNHEEKIKQNWIEKVKEQDTVLMPRRLLMGYDTKRYI